MKNRHVSTSTILEPYGLVRISGEVSRNPYHTFEERQFEPEFDVSGLRVIAADGEILQAPTCCQFEQWEIEKCREVLIEKFLDDEQAYKDALIDEAIERTRSFARNAYA